MDHTSPAPSSGPGRRANGLSSTDWGALVDLDPRLSEGLLDRLAQAGVAAYVEPASAVDTVSRAVTLPHRPLDRLWVDPGRADSAREVVCSEVADLTALLAEQDPSATAHGLVQAVPRYAARRVLTPPALPAAPASQPPALDDDAVFAQIVAGYGQVTDDPVPRWPAAEDLPADDGSGRGAPRPADPGAAAATPPRRRRSDPPRVELVPSWLEPGALEDDGHYEPPPPPPVPRMAARTALAVVGVLLGMVVLFAPRVLRLGETRGVALLGLAMVTGGAAALVWWMRDSADDDGDDGAVV